MEDALLQYTIFLLKCLTVVIATIVIIAAVTKQKHMDQKNKLQVKSLNDKYHNNQLTLIRATADTKALKKANNTFKQQQKKHKKNPLTKQVFVINFHGDIKASSVTQLSELINAIIPMRDTTHEVIVNIESTGGLVHAYGLAALQLQRLRQRNIPLTVCIDKVAASGGYMMAVLANKVIAAPFAIIGSIGVASEIPNIHRLLKKHDIDYEQITAGEFKRTMSMLAENTAKGRNKMQEDINHAHELFKTHVKTYRPQIDITAVATGEVWFGHDALEKKLVDQLLASHDYLLTACEQNPVFLLEINEKKSALQKVFHHASQSIQQIKTTLAQQSHDQGIMR
jgi:serine protease SohB